MSDFFHQPGKFKLGSKCAFKDTESKEKTLRWRLLKRLGANQRNEIISVVVATTLDLTPIISVVVATTLDPTHADDKLR